MTDLGDDHDDIHTYLARIASPIPDLAEVLSLLSAPLHALLLLPRNYEKYNTHPFKNASEKRDVARRLPAIHSALITHVLPVWYDQLVKDKHDVLVVQLFAPEPGLQYAGVVALAAYSSLTSHPLQDFCMPIMEALVKRYPMDVVYHLVFGKITAIDSRKQVGTWEEFVRCAASLPTKFSNWAGRGDGRAVPKVLEMGNYFRGICAQAEELVASTNDEREPTVQRVSFLFTKLINLGLFPASPSKALPPSQASFCSVTLPTLYRRIQAANTDEHRNDSSKRNHKNIWPAITSSLSRNCRSQVATSLIVNFERETHGRDLSSDVAVKKEIVLSSMLLGYIFGGFDQVVGEDEDEEHEDGELWDIVSSTMLAKHWDPFIARVFVSWVANCGDASVGNVKALETLLDKILELWADATYVRHSVLAQHQYLTSLLLLTLSEIKSLSLGEFPTLHFNPRFINGVSLYLSHLDPTVRRCGMLAAEVVAALTGKELSFGGWDEEGDRRGLEDGWKLWAKELRALVQSESRDWDIDRSNLFQEVLANSLPLSEAEQKDDTNTSRNNVPRETYTKSSKPSVHPAPDSDDESLAGYDSDDNAPGSRTPSPTPSELDEIEHDPTIHVGRKRIRPPVYLVDLGAMLRERFDVKGEEPSNKGGDDKAEEKAQAVRIALECAEDMIRRRRTFGAELDECAVDLAHALIGLKNNFELENFDDQRQKALTALVACAPRKAALTIAEELFKNQYSVNQRYVMLNAIALGARELAGLPVADLKDPDQKRLHIFPSKMLPPAIHARYADEEESSSVLALLTDDLGRRAVDGGQKGSTPRERRLRNTQANLGRITDITSTGPSSQLIKSSISSLSRPMESFTDVAVECFLGPLMGRFWNFVRDEQTRETRSALSASSDLNARYHPAGTGMVLSPLVLAHLVRTVSVLVHASRHSPLFLSIVVPDALEMAVVLGTRSVAGSDELNSDERKQEASVLHSSLELALITLDACLSLDGGRILAMEHTTLVLGVEEWAMRVVQEVEKGVKVGGAGGVLEAKLGRVAAGVVVKIDEAVGKWRRVMPMVGV